MLRAAAVFSDHMVLQRGRPIAVFGEADAPVTVSLAGVSIEAPPVNGRFEAQLPPMAAGGPHALRIACGGESQVFIDVMIGEVWLCGGQSNMEFRLRDERHFIEDAPPGDDALLRFYAVNQEARVDEAMLARERATAWKSFTPGSCGDVSAVAYYAGRRLREALDVPVGMLICCVGGSEADCWISREALAAFPEGRKRLEDFEALVRNIPDEQFEAENAGYLARVDRWNAEADALKAARPGILAVEIAARIGDFPWPPPVGRGMLRRPGNLWETMASRAAPYTARGLFWYQGEADALLPEGYAARFVRLIESWRRGFKNDGLYVVAAQLPGFAADPGAEDWPSIRGAQQAVCDAAEACALACLLDCGVSNDIHPREKTVAALRMANLALEHAYGLPIQADAPRLIDARREGGRVRLRFTEVIEIVGGSLRSLMANGVPARVADVKGDTLIVEVPSPARVAYAQENDPAPCLFGAETGLPAFPFEINA